MTCIEKALTFLKQTFPLRSWLDLFQDDRKRPIIPPGVVAQAVIEMVPRHQSSLLEVDQQVRAPHLRTWYGSERPMVVSDTTLFRSLGTFNLDVIHERLWDMAALLRVREDMKAILPSGKKIRLGIIDGSQWDRFSGSVLTLVGRRRDCIVNYRMSPGQGHELKTSRRLLHEAVDRLGSGFVDLIALDGLYMNREDLQWGVNHGIHLLVKNPSEEITVLRDAEELFFQEPKEMAHELDISTGYDEKRRCEYRITAAAGFNWNGVSLKVAHVRERHSKPKPGRPAETTFWVFTTDPDLSGIDMREVAHVRWHIENRTFRCLSGLVNSKRRITHDPHVREALLGLWFIGLNLFSVVAHVPPVLFRWAFGAMKVTWKFIGTLFVWETATLALSDFI